MISFLPDSTCLTSSFLLLVKGLFELCLTRVWPIWEGWWKEFNKGTIYKGVDRVKATNRRCWSTLRLATEVCCCCSWVRGEWRQQSPGLGRAAAIGETSWWTRNLQQKNVGGRSWGNKYFNFSLLLPSNLLIKAPIGWNQLEAKGLGNGYGKFNFPG